MQITAAKGKYCLSLVQSSLVKFNTKKKFAGDIFSLAHGELKAKKLQQYEKLSNAKLVSGYLFNPHIAVINAAIKGSTYLK